jgi:hypothetical protein
MAEEHVAQPCLQGSKRWLIHISECKVPAANEVIHLVAKDAIAGMLSKDIADNLDSKLESGKDKTELEN